MVIVQLTPNVMAEGMDVNFKSVSVVPPPDPPPPAPRLYGPEIIDSFVPWPFSSTSAVRYQQAFL